MTTIFNLIFEKIQYCEREHRFTNYPDKECEFILLTNENEFIHCISMYTLEDTPYGFEEMLTIHNFNDYNNNEILFENCSHIAYINKEEYL